VSRATYVLGDVRDVLAAIPDGSIDLVLTSPPFLALRSYLPPDHPDKHREIGAEPGPAEFIDTLLGLSAEWRRVLAPHGSIAVELGDTYAGSGGAGGDYADGGTRAGQERFDGSSSRSFGTGAAPRPARISRNRATSDGECSRPARGSQVGWPLDKSLCMIPELYRVALTYGVNPLTGDPSPAGYWRARNVVRWCRPNPPVGALGDKVRPATSDMVIACTSRTRYFDLDAIREPSSAPPLDHWWADPDDAFDQDAWLVSTEAYKGSHYATWPRKLLTRPLLAMCPERVCTVCGEPSRRIVETDRHPVGEPSPSNRARDEQSGNAAGTVGFAASGQTDRTTVGWSDCGHDSWRPGVVLDPFAGSGTTLAVATGHGRHALGIDFDARNIDLARERVGPMFFDPVALDEFRLAPQEASTAP